MKTTKEGKVKLEKGEVRVGNFFFRDEAANEHVKVTDLNTCFTLRVLKRMPLGIWLDNMMDMARTDGNAVDSLKTWASVMWSVLAVVPDDAFVKDLFAAAQAGLSRHPEWYGYDPEGDDGDAAQEVKDIKEFEKEARNLGEDGHAD